VYMCELLVNDRHVIELALSVSSPDGIKGP